MVKKLNNWERLEQVIRWADMTTNYFARHIGLARGENLYQIKRGNNGISLDLVEHIVAKFPQIDKLWLLTGEGSMFVSPDDPRPVPFYRADPEKELHLIEALSSDEYVTVPMAGACDFAMYYTGQAMGALLPAGSIVMLREVSPEMIFPGKEYVIVSKKIITLRTVRAAASPEQWRLVAGDSENFDDILLNKEEITKAYKVKVKITIND